MMRNILRISLSLIVVLAGGQPPGSRNAEANRPRQSAQQPNLGRWRFDLIPAWRRAVARHQPGEMDQAALEIEEWPKNDIQVTIGQVKMLAKLLAESPANALKSPIQNLLGLANEEMMTGNANRVLKRGALLHTDIAILGLVRAPDTHWETARYLVDDGRVIGLKVDPHWEFARLLLDSIQPKPSLDGMVLMWYRATAADLQNRREWGPLSDRID